MHIGSSWAIAVVDNAARISQGFKRFAQQALLARSNTAAMSVCTQGGAAAVMLCILMHRRRFVDASR